MNRVEESKNKAGAPIESIMEAAEDAAKAVAEGGREATERVQEMAGNMKGAISKSVKEQPVATLILVGAVGFLIGALWKS
jgi:ElaB/YqjD/DUF883 family membrane-anchored ribosome-binding protein